MYLFSGEVIIKFKYIIYLQFRRYFMVLDVNEEKMTIMGVSLYEHDKRLAIKLE